MIKKIIVWIRLFFIRPKLKFPLAITIYDLLQVLEKTIDVYCKIYLEGPKKYYVKFCEDIPYKFEFIVFNEDGDIVTSYTIVEMLNSLSYISSSCFDSIIGKLHSVETK